MTSTMSYDTTSGRKQATRRAVGLIRVSRVAGRGGDSFQSPEQQRDAIERLAAGRGYAIEEWLEELDVSGKTLERDAVERALELVERQEVEAVIAYDLSRFGRNTIGVLETRAAVHAAGGELVLGELDTSDTVAGDTITGIMAVVAQGEHRRISERFELSKLDAFERGVYLSSKAPFGYRHGDDRRLVVEPTEAAIVLELFELRARGGSWTEVVELFEERTGRSGVSRQSVRDVIQRRAYLGLASYRELERVSHEPIVTPELFEAAQKPSARWSSSTTRERFDGRAKSMLAGLARCETCGSKMHRTEAGSKRSLYYRCTSRSCTARAHVLLAELDAFVEAAILEWAEPVADELIVLDELHMSSTLEARRAELELELERAELGLDAWIDGSASTGLDAARIHRGTSARLAAVDAAKSELEAFDEANVSTAERSIVRTTLRQAWPTLDVLERRELLSSVLEAVVVGRGKIVNQRATVNQPIAGRVTLRFIATP